MSVGAHDTPTCEWLIRIYLVTDKYGGPIPIAYTIASYMWHLYMRMCAMYGIAPWEEVVYFSLPYYSTLTVWWLIGNLLFLFLSLIIPCIGKWNPFHEKGT